MTEQDPKEVAPALHELSRKELVRPARASSMEGQAEYAFFHALVRDVCYAQIPRASRAERHRRAGAWIEGVSGERVEDHAEILAAHYATALDLASATKDPATEELQAKALHYIMLAGDRAMGIDVEAAERHYARALSMAPEVHSERPEILARHGEALRQRGRFPEAALAFWEAIEGFRAKGDVRAMALGKCRQSVVLWRLGDPRNRAVSADALAMLEPLAPSPELVQALTEEAGASAVSGGEYDLAIDMASRAVALADELALPDPARALGFRGAARVSLGDAGASRTCAGRCKPRRRRAWGGKSPSFTTTSPKCWHRSRGREPGSRCSGRAWPSRSGGGSKSSSWRSQPAWGMRSWTWARMTRPLPSPPSS